MKVYPGERVRWNERVYQVVVVHEAFASLRSTEGGGTVEVLLEDLQVQANPVSAPSAQDLIGLRALDGLPQDARHSVDVWIEELDRLDELVAQGVPKLEAYKETTERVNRRLGTNYEESKARRQRKALADHGVSGLLDQRRYGLADISPHSYDDRLVQTALNVMADQTHKSTGTVQRLVWLIRRELDEQFGEGVVQMPSRATMYRLLEKLDAGSHTFGSARTRRTTANQPSRMFSAREGVRPGEQVLIDTTPMEILVACDGEAVRPDLTILLDAATRSVLAAIVTVGTRSIDLVMVLLRALVPYEYRPEGARASRRMVSEAWIGDDEAMADRFEELRAAQPYVFPESITTDRGKSYVSKHFMDVCKTLNISLTLAAVYTPTHKAKVERMFRTIKDLFTEYAVGFLGDNPDARGDEVISTDQLLTLEQLQELLEDWIAVTWQNRPHRALRDPRNPRLTLSPSQMVRAYQKVAPELHVPLDADRYVALLPTEWRHIHHYGVQIDLRIYDSEALGGLRRVRSPHARNGGRWPFHVDPYNPMTIWLEMADRFIPLEWKSPYNGAPMADEVWRVARAQAIARGANEPSVQDLNEVMRRFMNSGNVPAATKRERLRKRTVQEDRLALTNQILRNEPPEGEPQQGLGAAAERVESPVREWPDNGSFGFTRSGEEG